MRLIKELQETTCFTQPLFTRIEIAFNLLRASIPSESCTAQALRTRREWWEIAEAAQIDSNAFDNPAFADIIALANAAACAWQRCNGYGKAANLAVSSPSAYFI
ncbi:MAG: hypothetical protein AB1489_38840 [Acidobacteriota bacterium]